MKAIRLFHALEARVPGWALAPAPVLAAHAGEPYRNVDHRNDMGNDTGDSRVQGLNSTQLNENYRAPVDPRAPATNSPTTQTPPAYAPR